MAKPKTHAWYEIGLDEEKIGQKVKEDPLYQNRYLPRKFKVRIGIPPYNGVDIFIDDCALIAIIENAELKGFNLAACGGLGSTHGNETTYPRLASVLGFVPNDEERILKLVYEVNTVQRDFGNRADRKQARLKYTIDKLGVGRYLEEVEQRLGFKLEEARHFEFTECKDWYGWVKDYKGNCHYTLFVENGRVLDENSLQLKTALLKIAETGLDIFRFTVEQRFFDDTKSKQCYTAHRFRIKTIFTKPLSKNWAVQLSDEYLQQYLKHKL